MINLEKLEPILEGYKAYFTSHWDGEKYKWEAVKHFQEHWDIDAENFGDMFKIATDKTFNLLVFGYAYPRGMITNFAKADDEAARIMFRNLFDESQDLAARVDAFQTDSEELRAKYDDGTWRNHYQNTNAISTYLWLRYPDKYYIYKYELYRAAAKELDTELKTLTIDVGFYLARYYLKERKIEQEEGEWFPKDYSPELGVEEWIELLNDSSVFICWKRCREGRGRQLYLETKK